MLYTELVFVTMPSCDGGQPRLLAATMACKLILADIGTLSDGWLLVFLLQQRSHSSSASTSDLMTRPPKNISQIESIQE